MGVTLRPRAAVDAFAAEVSGDDAVTCVGGRTQWQVGGAVLAGTREVSAPSGVVAHEPADMTVVCGAGTPVAELESELAAHGQMVPLDPDDPAAATVGGVLAVGRSGPRRLRYGHIRDLLLQATIVGADGTVTSAGGPTVKNVSGYDLHRVQVGALGTLGFLAEVRLRCLPVPAVARWFTTGADPFALSRSLYRPSSVLWDGGLTWVLLEGHPDDVDAQAVGHDLVETTSPPPLPDGARTSHRPSALEGAAEAFGSRRFLAEVGVGVIHHHDVPRTPVPVRAPDALDLHLKLKQAFDPSGRLNPGRQPW